MCVNEKVWQIQRDAAAAVVVVVVEDVVVVVLQRRPRTVNVQLDRF